MPYSIDTSAILDAWVRYYPPDVFPSIWDHLDGAATSGLIFAVDEVLRELERKEDDAYRWVNQRSVMIVPIDADIQQAVSDILARHSRLLDTRKSRSGADPWVIALARVRDFAVVTGERPTGRPDRPHIPDVCSAMGIRCLNVLDFFREQRWRV